MRNMRSLRFLAALSLLATVAGGCSLISSKPYVEGKTKGIPYALPKGVVPLQVFIDNEKGIGLSIEPTRVTRDAKLGTLVAQLKHSPLNNEKITITADPNTGFLKAISTDSDAQLPQIFEEAAKSAARLALQNSRAAFLKDKPVIFEDVFDPLQSNEVELQGAALKEAILRECDGVDARNPPTVKLSVLHTDGTPFSPNTSTPETKHCADGICVRTITSLLIRINFGDKLLGSKLVDIPSREVFAVPVPSTPLADQDITVEISSGILAKYEFKRDSEILTLVKIPGGILAGVVNGLTQGLTDRKSILDKRKEVAESDVALTEALASRKKESESGAVTQGETTVPLQNASAGASARGTDYAAASLTVRLCPSAPQEPPQEPPKPNRGGRGDLWQKEATSEEGG